ncbi:porin [Methylobacterium variabile]|jgi:hypothetical protein|nr:porin [Methylobacterium variabile]
MRFTFSSLTVALLSSGFAHAADLAAPAPAPVAVVERCKATLSLPAYGGFIKPNPNPSCFTLGGFGDIYVGGAITGYAYTQTNPFPYALPGSTLPTDRGSRVDFTNIQGWVQKADGPFQFYVQAGAYAIPALGFINLSALDQTDLLFTPLPVAFGKFVINDNWSIQGGRMPTLIGTEAPFTFQNFNISRGLLFNQENIINHGVQVNYSDGPWSASVAGTDGFFSGKLSWFTGAITYKLDDNNSFGINGGLNLDRTDVLSRSVRYSFATPLFQQNSGILSINYTYSNGPWTITPYFQYTNVARDFKIGIVEGASTYGGAVLANYAFTDNFALAGRVEYITQTGDRFSGLTSLLYGPGSSALSFTITPTFTFDRYFVRAEYSRVQLYDTVRGDLTAGTIGSGFGRTGNRTSQDRYMIEGGITF